MTAIITTMYIRIELNLSRIEESSEVFDFFHLTIDAHAIPV